MVAAIGFHVAAPSPRLRIIGSIASEVVIVVISTGRRRDRPVLITTLTTSLGMVPMILSRGEGAATWKPMAATIAGGLTVSMLVTLVLVPTLYSLFHARAERKRLEASAAKGVLP